MSAATITRELEALRLQQLRPKPLKLTRRGRAVRFVAITTGAAACLSVGLVVGGDASDPFACPRGASLTVFEDGSGACYAPDSRTPIVHHGRAVQWGEGTFPWNCATDGNKVCGP